ncbi:SusC/RagA family TonB-linked outer membrane protein [Rhodocytophaga rosea]|nr:TonB-dependent receptor [Rhodocytophaga rosea]
MSTHLTPARYSLSKKILLMWLIAISSIPLQSMAQELASYRAMPERKPGKQQLQDNKSLITVLSELSTHYKVKFDYEKQILEGKAVQKQPFTGNNLDKTLTEILQPLELTFEKFSENNYLIYSKKQRKEIKRIEKEPFSSSRNLFQFEALENLASVQLMSNHAAVLGISGKVTDDQGQNLPGVNVVIKGTSQGTTTDVDGKYSLNAPDGNGTLVFSYIGFTTEEVPINNRATIDVSLMPDIQSLSEVVVVGYGTQRKTDVTGSLASISVKEFEAQPVTRVDQILQGRATGVQVTNASGAPGGGVRIRVRGANSIFGDNNPLYVVDGYVGADFTTINPNDIESIQVLKDASSTAIYGSRGANGVVIITTKRGAKGGIKVNYNRQVSTSNVIGLYNTLSAGDFAQVVNERAAATGTSQVFTQNQVDEFRRTGGTDWQDEIFRTALGQEHQLGVSGGNEKTTFLISGNYLNQEGIIQNTDYQRYSIRSNIASQVSEKFSLRLNVTGSRLINHNTGILTGTSNPVVQALAWSPTTPVKDATGGYTMNDPLGSVGTNPVALINDRQIDQERSLGNIVGGARYEFIKGLALDVQLAVNYLNQQDKTFNGNFVSRNNPSAYRASTEQITLQSTNALSYKRTFNEVHTIDAVGVFETQQFTSNSFNATGNTLKDASLGYYNIGLAGSYAIGSGYSKWTLLSYLGRVNYSFKDKYLISGTLRRDGSSKFQKSNRYSVFPSIAVGWRVSEEPFLKNLNVFNNFKIRGSWGLTGSQAINSYATQSTYNTSPLVAFNNTGASSGIMLGNPGNPKLKWETTEQFNIGAEMEFLKGRITLEGDYFVKNTTDLLLNQPLPGYVGGGNIAQNLGEIQNKGWEFSLGATVLEVGDFNWTSAFNISNVKNTVVSIGGIADKLFTNTNVGAGMSTQSEYVYAPGQALGAYWGLKYLGTWKPGQADEASRYGEKTGDSRYQDLNDDGAINTQDFQIIGSGIPRTSAGWNNTFTYKGLTLNIFFQGIFGVDKLNYTRAAAIAGSADARQPILEDIKNRYIPGVNETSDIPAFSITNRVYTQSTRFMEKGDFVRLKNISLSYNLPSSWIRNVGTIRVFVSGTNLITITKYKGIDPESSSVNGSDTALGIDYGAYPNSKIYTAGLNLTF